MKVSLASFDVRVPVDGLPSCLDWLTVVESMLLGGVDFAREPLSANYGKSAGQVGMFELDIVTGWEFLSWNYKLSLLKLLQVFVIVPSEVKGYTKLSACLFIVLIASSSDLETDWEKLLALQNVLDKCVQVPAQN